MANLVSILVFQFSGIIFAFIQAHSLRAADISSSSLVFEIFNLDKEIGSGSLILDKILKLLSYVLDIVFGYLYNGFAIWVDIAAIFAKDREQLPLYDVLKAGVVELSLIYWILLSIALVINGRLMWSDAVER